jgi:hypothetical protein
MRINGTTKAPIVNHLAEAIAGGSTIRAFKKEVDFTVENLCLIEGLGGSLQVISRTWTSCYPY